MSKAKDASTLIGRMKLEDKAATSPGKIPEQARLYHFRRRIRFAGKASDALLDHA